MKLPILIDNRLRRSGAAVIGSVGAILYGGAMLWMHGDKGLHPGDRVFFLLFAVLGAMAGWYVIGWLGRPGWRGVLRDIALMVLVLMLTTSLGMAGFAGPGAVLAPFIVLLSLAHPLTAAILCIGGAVLLTYARLTAPKNARPPTIPRA